MRDGAENHTRKTRPQSAFTGLLCHLALWFGPLFATPLFIALNNPEDIVIPLPALARFGGGAWLLVSVFGWLLASRAATAFQWRLNRVLLAVALVTAVQANVVHELFYYGAFNGERFDLRVYGWKFWLEGLAWLAALPLTAWLLLRLQRLPAWLAALPVASFSLLLLTALQTHRADAAPPARPEAVQPDVYSFSSIRNLIHLLPDGLQGDLVRQVFEEHPELAAEFEGFTLFTDHLGSYPGTAPAVFTMLTGEPFPFEQGWDAQRVERDLRAGAYPRELAARDWRLDYVPISPSVCLQSADSCHVRSFNDMKARGYHRERVTDRLYQLRLITDLTLFRLLPMFLKERVYNQGLWLFADTRLDGASPWPDPVLREWSAGMKVISDRPVYKWYHYIGAHMPARWDADCRLTSRSGEQRADFLAQTRCVLRGIAGLLGALRAAGIYDRTAILVSGDHGVRLTPDDLGSPSLNGGMYPGLMGYGRPALLVKRLDDRAPLRFSERPTHLSDIAATALDLAGLEGAGTSAFAVPENARRTRVFQHYSVPLFFSGEAVPYVEYEVGRPVREGRLWKVSDIRNYRQTPAGYDPLNRSTGSGHVIGARLRKSFGHNKSSWVTGRQLAFVIDLPSADPPNGASGTDQALEITLHIPDGMPVQALTASLNGGRPWSSPELRADAERFWQIVRVPLMAPERRPGRNFVSLEFRELQAVSDDEPGGVAALLRSIVVVDQPAASSRLHQ